MRDHGVSRRVTEVCSHECHGGSRESRRARVAERRASVVQEPCVGHIDHRGVNMDHHHASDLHVDFVTSTHHAGPGYAADVRES